MSSPKSKRRIQKRPGRAAHGSLHRHGSALASDIAELTLLACTIRHNAFELQLTAERMMRIADMLEANRARLKAQNEKGEPR
jgi:hypothetical protein